MPPERAVLISRQLLDDLAALPGVESVRVAIEVMESDTSGPERWLLDLEEAAAWLAERQEAAHAAAERAAWDQAQRADITVSLYRDQLPVYEARHLGGDSMLGKTEEAALRELLDHRWRRRG